MSSEFGERLEMAQDAFNDLLLERDTLIIALRECVVALNFYANEKSWLDQNFPNGDYLSEALVDKGDEAKIPLAHAKSTLERYGDK